MEDFIKCTVRRIIANIFVSTYKKKNRNEKVAVDVVLTLDFQRQLKFK